MSGVTTSAARLPQAPAAPGSGLPQHSRRFFLSVVLSAAVVGASAAITSAPASRSDWSLFTLLLVGAAIAHYFVVHVAKNQIFHVGLVFTVAAAVSLPPRLVVAMCLTQHLFDWAKERYAWYIQTFNIGNYLFAALGAHYVASLAPTGGGVADELGGAAIGVSACAAFVLTNHVLLAQMLNLARGWSFRESSLFKIETLATDFILALFGLAVAILWQLDPWALPIACAPLLLVQRALTIPLLWAEARIDAKTGLFNIHHFNRQLESELARAARFGRPLSLLMADLDLLREVNNRYGHLAGDAVLKGVADILRLELRDYDVAARFGGEEFVVLLPETSLEDAVTMAERIRGVVEEHSFSVDSAGEPVRATLSIGAATFLCDEKTAKELVHEADLALYRAKSGGRNRVSG
jgi:diguanylate cyclase (GGDEF)-like protein